MPFRCALGWEGKIWKLSVVISFTWSWLWVLGAITNCLDCYGSITLSVCYSLTHVMLYQHDYR